MLHIVKGHIHVMEASDHKLIYKYCVHYDYKDKN
jgi:hypothetical protein